MIERITRMFMVGAIGAMLLCPVVFAQDSGEAAGSGTEVTVPEPTPEDARIFADHITWLASPFLKGRLPGTPEMEIARNYIEYWFKKVGLQPAWGGDNSKTIGEGATSYRQPFEFGGTRNLKSVAFSLEGDGRSFAADTDIRGMVQGASGEANADIVFLGYGITKGKDGYESFNDQDDLKGKIAMVFYFEPMKEDGTSKWADGRWSRSSSSWRKSLALKNKGLAGMIMVIPPGVKDDRATLAEIRDMRRQTWDCPMISMSAEAAEALVKAGDPEGRDLMTLRKLADDGRVVVPMKKKATMKVDVEVRRKKAENVGGLIPGKGKLAGEVIVVGAHIDHLGVGNFGSRARNMRGTIHPGADDNASGAAALIMMAERLVKYYDSLPDGADARTILFAGLDAEEQGLHGARYYTTDPLVPLDRHALMINFDMIGRITKKQLRLDGAKSAKGLEELIDPLLNASSLDIKKGKSIMMASDHAAFYGAGVPVLFSIITPFHDDYHTPRDTSAKINAEDGARVVELYTEITKKVAQHPGKMEFQGRTRTPRR